MSYVVPSVLVYQQLATAGGVLNATPDLNSLIIGPCYNVVNYTTDTAATLLTSQAVDVNGTVLPLTNAAQVNTFYLPSKKVGQLVDSASVSVILNRALVESKVEAVTLTAASNVIPVAGLTAVTGSMTSGSAVLSSLGSPNPLNEGDNVVVAGAGVAGANLSTYVLSVSGTSATLASNASTTVTGAAVTRASFNNTNPATASLRVEPGDQVVITYGSSTVSTTVLAVTGTASAVTGFTTTDVMPTGSSGAATVSIRKSYNNLTLPLSYNSNVNYSLANVTTDGTVALQPNPKVAYGTVVSGNVHLPYKALRTDLSSTVQEISSIDELTGVLGEATDANPLGLAVELALANTTTSIFALAVPTDDLAGYTSALQLIETLRMYCIVALTQDASILGAVKQHVLGMSTPENAAWRITLVNTPIPSTQNVGQYSADLVNSNGGNNTIVLQSGQYILTSSNSTFISDGVTPGDTVVVTAGTPGTIVGSFTVQAAISNQQVSINASATATGVSFYIKRALSKPQQAASIAANSSAFSSNRVIHVQPDTCGVVVSGVTKYLPGYYLCAGLAGLVAGLPAQQGLTSIAPAGIADLKKSNFYFTRAQLSTIAAAGTLLMVQETQGSIPYVRHSLTTDLSALAYRELQQVKNWDFLSYAFYDTLKPYIAKYNITPDTLQILRTAIQAEVALLQGKKLPKVGAPLISATIQTLKQDPNNKDNVIIELLITIPTVMNYISLYLVL